MKTLTTLQQKELDNITIYYNKFKNTDKTSISVIVSYTIFLVILEHLHKLYDHLEITIKDNEVQIRISYLYN